MADLTPEQQRACMVLRELLKAEQDDMDNDITHLKIRAYDSIRKGGEGAEKEMENIAGRIYVLEDGKHLLNRIATRFRTNILIEEKKGADV